VEKKGGKETLTRRAWRATGGGGGWIHYLQETRIAGRGERTRTLGKNRPPKTRQGRNKTNEIWTRPVSLHETLKLNASLFADRNVLKMTTSIKEPDHTSFWIKKTEPRWAKQVAKGSKLGAGRNRSKKREGKRRDEHRSLGNCSADEPTEVNWSN